MVAKLTLVGNLGADPEVRRTVDGNAVINFRVASNFRRQQQPSREWVEQTNWYRVTVFGRLAERLQEQAREGRLAKGTRLIVFGRLEATAYLDRNNQPQPSLDVVADDVVFAEGRRADEDRPDRIPGSGEVADVARQRTGVNSQDSDVDSLEDLPF